MTVSRRHIDLIFLALLILDAGVIGLFLADFGISASRREPMSFLAGQNGLRDIVLGVLAAKFLSTGGLLLGLTRRHAPFASPSRVFLLLAAATFLGLAGWLGQRSLIAASSLALSNSVLPLALGAAILIPLGGRSWQRLWRFYQQESLIMLAGGWMLLFGSVGLEILGKIYPGGVQVRMVEPALEKFCLMTGASILLYGVLRFALRKERLDGLLWPARC